MTIVSCCLATHSNKVRQAICLCEVWVILLRGLCWARIIPEDSAGHTHSQPFVATLVLARHLDALTAQKNNTIPTYFLAGVKIMTVEKNEIKNLENRTNKYCTIYASDILQRCT